MVILQNTDAHTLVGWYLPEFLYVDVIKILHSNGQLVRPISRGVPYRELHSGCTQFVDDFFREATSPVAPETDAHVKFVKVVAPRCCG